MNTRDFFARRFDISENKTFNIGDEVVNEYGVKGIIVREPYRISNEEFTLVYYGQLLSSTSTKNLVNTNKHYKEMEIILKALKEADNEIDN